MTDSLRSVRQRQQMAVDADLAAEREAADRRRRPWRYVPAEARASLLAVGFMFMGLAVLVTSTGTLVGLLTGSGVVGIAASGVVLGLAWFTIGVLLGLNS